MAIDQSTVTTNHSFSSAFLLGTDTTVESADNAMLSEVYEQDYYSFNVTQNASVTLTIDGSSGGDSMLYLFDSEQSQIAYDDDSGSGNFSKISNQQLAAGTYYVMVKAYSSKTIANYNLTINLNLLEEKSLVVTTGADIVDATDGLTSLREAVTYAAELGGKQMVTFNIAGCDEFHLDTPGLYVPQNVIINGFNQATGNLVCAKEVGNIASDIGAVLENFIYLPDTTGRMYGDITVINGIVKNFSWGSYADTQISNSTTDSMRILSQGQLMLYNTIAHDLTVDYQGVLIYSTGNIFSGTLTISGAVTAKIGNYEEHFGTNTKTVDFYTPAFSGNRSQVGSDTNVVLDLSNWTADAAMTHLSNWAENVSYVGDVTCSHSMLIDNLKIFSGAGSYTVNVKENQTLGNYQLAGNAADFNSAFSLTVGGTTYHDVLLIGDSCRIAGRKYTLTQNSDNVLILNIEELPVIKATRDDFDGNRVADILFQNLTDAANPLGAWLDADKWQWDGTLGPAAKSDWTVYGAFDFTGDGVCDIMFRSKLESTAYAVGYYDMGNGREFKTMGWGVTAEWELANVGDFNGNGKSDILWKNTTNGYLGLWMDGTDQWVALPASALGDGQSIIGMGDVNNDGCDDILINSNGVLGAWDITGILEGTEGTPVWSSFGITISSDWETIGCADFDGNGKADIVLWNDNTGYVGTYMNCDGSDFRAIYPSAAKDEWGIPGFGDYDGDGTEDVLVRNLASGALGYWDGNDNFAWHEIGCGVDSTWAVIA